MPPKSPGRPRSERAKTAILESAFDILEDEGMARVTIEAVAAQANVGKPTIYRYWNNAQELAMAAVMARSELQSSPNENQSPFEELKHQLQQVIERFGTPAGRQTAILMASSHWDSELSKAFRTQVILKSREQGRHILQRAIEAGLVKTDLPIESVLDMIYGPVFYRLLAGHAPLKKTFADDIVDTLIQSICTS